ncbi:MAG: AsnC family transcriptional regulator, partial [Nitrosopumilales archaeon CG15_BIG_FIL_POST_REV_8_21_14_020_37_12]
MSEYCVLLVNETGTDDSVISALRNIETVKAAY